MKAPRIGSVWQGWKGGTYQITGVGRHTEGEREYLVGYLDEKGDTHFRPLSMWYDTIDRDGFNGPRFIELGVPNGTSRPVFSAPTASSRPTKQRRGF